MTGNGSDITSGDDGPASLAALRQPTDVALDASGRLFIADENAGRVRRVDSDGTIHTVVGRGTNGSLGDGGPADLAEVSWPTSVELDASGNLYLVDSCFGRIRKVAGAAAAVPAIASPGAP